MKNSLLVTHTNIVGAVIMVTALFSIPVHAFQDAVDKNTPEVVDIVGEPPLAFYRNSLHEAEDSFFGMLNDTIEDDDFKVTCKTQLIQSFSRLKDRVCEANFVSRITSGETRDGAEGAALPSNLKIRRQLEKKQREYAELLVEKINGDPRILRAYQALELAKQKYKIAKEN